MSRNLARQFRLPRVQIRAVSNAAGAPGAAVGSAQPSQPAQPAATPATSSPAAGPSQPRTTHFGFQEVFETDKESLVGSVFSSVASNYDVMNDSMSLGIHRLWKDDFVSTMLPRLPASVHRNPARPGVAPAPEAPNPTVKCIDVAGGTGDIALRILDRAREKFGSRDIEVEVVDLNPDMLHEGRKRVAQTMYYNTPQITFTHGNAQALPAHIEDNSIDLYTIAFGIRNCTSLPAVLSEAYRVLKPGGRIGVLEFGKVSNPLLKEAYRQYSFQVIPVLGQIIAGDHASYKYLVESIERFPQQADFAQLVRDAGFQTGAMREGKGGAWKDYTFGVATMWTGVKA
ncbi:hypothetical protein CspHIS471_0700240 [Cutaneotrichosporon sp. HIS471]|nr:hypothetical protein CspHIS471_0700240 [Cutaneotrichosporon sp. HIS471]